MFWNALKSAGLAYNPLSYVSSNSRDLGDSRGELVDDVCVDPSDCSDDVTQEGIFPLTYLNGVDGIFLSIASSSERAIELYEKTMTVIQELEK